MRQRFQFPLAVFPLTTLVVALWLARGGTFFFWLLFTLVFTIYGVIELMARRMPAALLNASQDNCHRLDGSRSRRRTARESKALRKVRTDLWAIMLMVMSVATAEVYAFHLYVFPLSLGGEVAAALGDASGDLKGALRQRNVDGQFFRWSRETTRASNAEIRERMQVLWFAWPILIALLLTSAGMAIGVVRYSYLRILREFQQGVAARAQQYLNLDTARLQG